MSQRIFKDEILTLIPHAGLMCFWDTVEHWDADRIRCSTMSHRDAQHPLRYNDQLSAIHLAEYGAQAMAIHGGLLAREAGAMHAPGGMLASLRDFVMNVQRIDHIEAPLIVHAQRLVANAGGSIYEFTVRAGEHLLARGRASAVMPRSTNA